MSGLKSARARRVWVGVPPPGTECRFYLCGTSPAPLRFLSRAADFLRIEELKERMAALLAATTSMAAPRTTESALPPFASVVDAHKAMVYSIAWQFLRDRVAADELAQDVFLQLHKNWNRIESPAHLLFWLRKVATHRAIDAARKRKAKAETSLEETDEPTVLERVHDSLLSSYLQRMVGSLPEKQRSVLVLRYQEDMELEEIAQVLSMNVSTVKTQISRGLDLLRGKVSRRLGKGDMQ